MDTHSVALTRVPSGIRSVRTFTIAVIMLMVFELAFTVGRITATAPTSAPAVTLAHHHPANPPILTSPRADLPTPANLQEVSQAASTGAVCHISNHYLIPCP